MIKTMTKSNWGWTSFFQFILPYHSPSLREVMARAQGETWRQELRQKCVYSLAFPDLLSLFHFASLVDWMFSVCVWGRGLFVYLWVCFVFVCSFVCLLFVWDVDSLCSLAMSTGLVSNPRHSHFSAFQGLRLRGVFPTFHINHQSRKCPTGLPMGQPDGALSYIAFFSDDFSLHWFKKSLN